MKIKTILAFMLLAIPMVGMAQTNVTILKDVGDQNYRAGYSFGIKSWGKLRLNWAALANNVPLSDLFNKSVTSSGLNALYTGPTVSYDLLDLTYNKTQYGLNMSLGYTERVSTPTTFNKSNLGIGLMVTIK